MSESEQFDFDGWKDLAHTDPQAYFAERRRVIENFINTCPPDKQAVLRLQIRFQRNSVLSFLHPVMPPPFSFHIMETEVPVPGNGILEPLAVQPCKVLCTHLQVPVNKRSD